MAQPKLHSLLLYDELHRNATNVTRINNLDYVCNNDTCELAICHLSAVLAITHGNFEPEQESFQDAASISLALQHLNTGDGSLVPQVSGLNERCPIRFTMETSDSQYSAGVALQQVLKQTNRNPAPGERLPCAFLGATRSAVSIPTSIVTGLLGYPQISFKSTSAELEDTVQYPLFGRTVPSDEGTTIPIVMYLRNTLQVKHLAVIHVNDAYGNNYAVGLREAALKHAPDMTIHQIPLIDGQENIQAAVDALVSTEFRFVFCLVFSVETHDALMTEAYRRGVAGTGDHNWLFADTFHGVLASRVFQKDSPLHKAYRGSASLAVSGGVSGFPAYDKFVSQLQQLGSSSADLQYLGSLFPVHDHPNYQGNRPKGEPPFVTNPDVLRTITGGFSPLAYEGAIALGLSACAAHEENGALSGTEHFRRFLNSTFDGISGSVKFSSTGTREPNSVFYKVENYVERLSPNKNLVEFDTVVTSVFQEGGWQQREEFIFNDGSSNLPSDLPPPALFSGMMFVLIVGVPLIVILFLTIIVLLWRGKRRKDNDSFCEIQTSELSFSDPPEVIGRSAFGLVLLAEYRGTQVAVKRVLSNPKENDEGSNLIEADGSFYWPKNHFTRTFGFRKMKNHTMQEWRYLSKMRHPCVATIMGVAAAGPELMLVMEYMEHGSLRDVIQNETISIEDDLATSILRDISQGVRFLHSATPAIVHGDLMPSNILIGAQFRAKVTRFGMSQKKSTDEPENSYWMAPELLRNECSISTAADAYAFGILMYEIYSRREPYEDENPLEVLRLVADKTVKKRPPVPRSMGDKMKSLMTDCLEEEADQRPTFEELDIRLKRIDDTHMSGQVKPSVSLFDIFPKHIAEALRDGRQIDAEHRDCVTIFFSDIVGFTTLSSKMHPRKVADLMDRLYTKFDQLSQKHDIFKVETVGDAYMCVANLVKDQPDDHTKRIAEFSIDAIGAANATPVDPDDPSKGYVNLRIGFHSGSCVADCVGTRNPRYCLFGDSVNISARMESHSEANRIHCSKEAARLLRKQWPSLPLKSRGLIDIKGKGEMKTYWVNEGNNNNFADCAEQGENVSESAWTASEMAGGLYADLAHETQPVVLEEADLSLSFASVDDFISNKTDSNKADSHFSCGEEVA